MKILLAFFGLFMPKKTIDGAIANIAKGIKHLDVVIDDAQKAVDKAVASIEKANVVANESTDKAARAARIKSKLETLVA